jgi:hypothetical protein
VNLDSNLLVVLVAQVEGPERGAELSVVLDVVEPVHCNSASEDQATGEDGIRLHCRRTIAPMRTGRASQERLGCSWGLHCDVGFR